MPVPHRDQCPDRVTMAGFARILSEFARIVICVSRAPGRGQTRRCRSTNTTVERAITASKRSCVDLTSRRVPRANHTTSSDCSHPLVSAPRHVRTRYCKRHGGSSHTAQDDGTRSDMSRRSSETTYRTITESKSPSRKSDDPGIRDPGSGARDSGFGIRDSGFELRLPPST